MVCVLAILTAAQLVYLTFEHALAPAVVGVTILGWAFGIVLGIGMDCWKLKFLPSVIGLGALAALFAAVLYLFSPHKVVDSTAIEFTNWLDVLPLGLLFWLVGLSGRWATRRSLAASRH
jgi:hypothetical protein